jgi:hypothetical protein
MSPPLIDLLAKSGPQVVVLLAAVVGFGVVLGIVLADMGSQARRQAWRERNRKRFDNQQRPAEILSGLWPPKPEPTPKPLDAADQLRTVMGATFTIQPLLNRSEARLFRELDRLVISCNPEWQVMAQVSLGEVLSSKDPKAYSCINAKRVDLLLMDQNCQPRHAIEYQGGAHHQGMAAARDAVKKEALRRAGIGYHEVIAGRTTPSELKRLVEGLVDKPLAPAQPQPK